MAMDLFVASIAPRVGAVSSQDSRRKRIRPFHSKNESLSHLREVRNPPHHVHIDVHAEGQRNLLDNSPTTQGRVTSFHFNDGIDQFFERSLQTRPSPRSDEDSMRYFRFVRR